MDKETFSPDDSITQIDFFKYLLSTSYSTNNEDDLYNYLIQKNIITNAEKDATKVLTRQDVAKYIARMIVPNNVASISEIYKYPYADEISPNYVGYISICSGLKIMSGDKNGYFNPTKEITNAEVAALIYNIYTSNLCNLF